jgi:hypothetical protein
MNLLVMDRKKSIHVTLPLEFDLSQEDFDLLKSSDENTQFSQFLRTMIHEYIEFKHDESLRQEITHDTLIDNYLSQINQGVWVKNDI